MFKAIRDFWTVPLGNFSLYIFRSPLPLGDRDRPLHKARAGVEPKGLAGYSEKKRCTEKQVKSGSAPNHTAVPPRLEHWPPCALTCSFTSTRDQLRTLQTWGRSASQQSTHGQEAGQNLFLDPFVRSLKIIYEEKTQVNEQGKSGRSNSKWQNPSLSTPSPTGTVLRERRDLKIKFEYWVLSLWSDTWHSLVNLVDISNSSVKASFSKR